MRFLRFLPPFLLMILSVGPALGQDATEPEPPMTPVRLHAILEAMTAEGGEFEAQENVARILVRDLELICIHDEVANRMRLLSSIKPEADLTADEKEKMLAANFHSALDGRYCVANGTVYAAFIHPLDSLNERDLQLAVYQVLSLNFSFGDDYSSGIFQYGGASEEEERDGEAEDEDEKKPLPNEA